MRTQTQWINSNRGVVIKTDQKNITIMLPKGGSIRAPNIGYFHPGDEVCFTLNSAGTKPVLIIPAELADWKQAIATNPLLNESIRKEPPYERCEFSGEVVDDIGDGYPSESDIDLFGGVPREEDQRWDGYIRDDSGADYATWDEDTGILLPEESDEAHSVHFQLQCGWSTPEEMDDRSSEQVDDGWADSVYPEGY